MQQGNDITPDILCQPWRPIDVHGQVAGVEAHLPRSAAGADHPCAQPEQAHIMPARGKQGSRHALLVTRMQVPPLNA